MVEKFLSPKSNSGKPSLWDMTQHDAQDGKIGETGGAAGPGPSLGRKRMHCTAYKTHLLTSFELSLIKELEQRGNNIFKWPVCDE